MILHSSNKRNITIDLIKALGIIMMVAQHCYAPVPSIFFLFHMSIFFIASGYFYKPQVSDNISYLKKYIIKKIKSLWFPYFFWISAFSICHNFFIHINISTNNIAIYNYAPPQPFDSYEVYWSTKEIIFNVFKAFFLGSGANIAGAFWFLRILFMISISHCIIDFLIKKIFHCSPLFLQIVISLVFLSLGYMCNLNNIHMYGIEQVLSCYSLYHFGTIIAANTDKYSCKNIYIKISLFIISFFCLLFLNKWGPITLALNEYKNPPYLLFASLVGWIFIYEAATFIKNIYIIQKPLSLIGRNTLCILILHLLCFKIINALGVLYYKEPCFKIAALPVLYTGTYWWMAYTFVGIAVPIALNTLKNYIQINHVFPILYKRI